MQSVAILSSASAGGAGLAARRLADALARTGRMHASFLDRELLNARPSDDAIFPGSATNRRYTNTHFTLDFQGLRRSFFTEFLRGFDLVNVHWAQNFVTLAELISLAEAGQPLLVTLHDYHYITGGCHYPAGCTGFRYGCVGCPQVADPERNSRHVMASWRAKRRLFSHNNVHLSAPSQFLVTEAVSSGLVSEERTHVLRNAYTPRTAPTERSADGAFNIAIIVDSVKETRKGFALALASLQLASSHLCTAGAPDIHVHVVGQPDEDTRAQINATTLICQVHGRIEGQREIETVLNRCHFLLSTSFEDNWPNVLVEGACMGVIPIVGVGHGCAEFSSLYGIPFVASNYTSAAFAKVIVRAIKTYSPVTARELSTRAREDHHPDKVSKAFANVCLEIASDSKSSQAPAADAVDSRTSSMFKRLRREGLISANHLPLCRRIKGKDSAFTPLDSGPFGIPRDGRYGFTRYQASDERLNKHKRTRDVVNETLTPNSEAGPGATSPSGARFEGKPTSHLLSEAESELHLQQYIQMRARGKHREAHAFFLEFSAREPAKLNRVIINNKSLVYVHVDDVARSISAFKQLEHKECHVINVPGNMGNSGIFLHKFSGSGNTKQTALSLVEKISISARDALFYLDFYPLLHAIDPAVTPKLYTLGALSRQHIQIYLEWPGPQCTPRYDDATAGCLASHLVSISKLPRLPELRKIKPVLTGDILNRLQDEIPRRTSWERPSLTKILNGLRPALPNLNTFIREIDFCTSHCDVKWQNLVRAANAPPDKPVMLIDWGQFGVARIGSDLREFIETDPKTGKLVHGAFVDRLLNEYAKHCATGRRPYSPVELQICAAYEQLCWAAAKINRDTARSNTEPMNERFANIVVGSSRHLVSLLAHINR
jgi:hypothetical protein